MVSKYDHMELAIQIEKILAENPHASISSIRDELTKTGYTGSEAPIKLAMKRFNIDNGRHVFRNKSNNNTIGERLKQCIEDGVIPSEIAKELGVSEISLSSYLRSIDAYIHPQNCIGLTVDEIKKGINPQSHNTDKIDSLKNERLFSVSFREEMSYDEYMNLPEKDKRSIMKSQNLTRLPKRIRYYKNVFKVGTVDQLVKYISENALGKSIIIEDFTINLL